MQINVLDDTIAKVREFTNQPIEPFVEMIIKHYISQQKFASDFKSGVEHIKTLKLED